LQFSTATIAGAETNCARTWTVFERHPEADLTISWSDWIDASGQPTGLHSRRCEGAFSFRSLVEDFVIGNTSSAVLPRSACATRV